MNRPGLAFAESAVQRGPRLLGCAAAWRHGRLPPVGPLGCFFGIPVACMVHIIAAALELTLLALNDFKFQNFVIFFK